jgi:hypothetical protein
MLAELLSFPTSMICPNASAVTVITTRRAGREFPTAR